MIKKKCQYNRLKRQNHGLKRQNHGSKRQNHGSKRQNHGLKRQNHGLKRQNHGSKRQNHGSKRQNHGLYGLKDFTDLKSKESVQSKNLCKLRNQNKSVILTKSAEILTMIKGLID